MPDPQEVDVGTITQQQQGAGPSITASVQGDIIRGSSVTFTVNNLPQDATITAWRFREDGNVNTTVDRPSNENRNINWEGVMIVSGRIIVEYLSSQQPRQIELHVNVVPRTGWNSNINLHPEMDVSTFNQQHPRAWRNSGAPSIPPQDFDDLGRHFGVYSGTIPQPRLINNGPNSGYKYFISPPTITFDSYGIINDHLLDSNSAFSRAQDGKVYLIQPGPIREVGLQYYTLDGNLEPVINDVKAFCAAYGIRAGVPYVLSPQRITHANLLAFTRRHEYQGTYSHRSNFVSAINALDPVKYAEKIFLRPNSTEDLIRKIRNRIDMIMTVLRVHDVVDEASTRIAENIIYIYGARILDCNEDDNGNFAGIVWNPANNRMFR